MIVKKNLKALKEYKPGKPIEELKRSLKLKQVYKLASNEIPFYPSYINKAVALELKNVNRYPEADCYKLRKLLSRKLKIRGEQIVFGNGSDELIVLALRGLCTSRGNVVVGFPTFLIYEIQAKVTGVGIKRVPLKNYRYDLDAIARVVDKNTQIIFIANPDNPHGTYVNHNQVKRFLRKIPKGIVVFFDEAYFEFVPKNDFPRSFSFLRDRGNIIIARTFSKAYGLAGLRIGYAVTTLEIAEILNKVREPFNVGRIAQVAAIEAVKNKVFLNKTVKYIEKERDFLCDTLDVLGVEFIKSVTNFILVNFRKDADKLCDYLLKKGIIVRNMTSWGLKHFLRVTVGLHRENLAFIKHFRDYLDRQE